jgi:hypothetical protein
MFMVHAIAIAPFTGAHAIAGACRANLTDWEFSFDDSALCLNSRQLRAKVEASARPKKSLMSPMRFLPSLVAASLLGAGMGHAQYLGLRVDAADGGSETLLPGSALGSWQRLGARQETAQPVAYSRVTESSGQLGVQRTSGVYQPLSQSLASLIETSHATLGDLGTEWSVLGQVGASLGQGWGIQAGLRHSEAGLTVGPGQPYAARLGYADLGMLTLEHNWHGLRSAYTLFGSYADNGAAASGHRVDLQYYYSERSNFGLSYTAARAFQAAPALSVFQPLEGSHLGVAGEHWFSPAWAVNYRALVQDLGPASGLSGLKPQIRFGLRYTF